MEETGGIVGRVTKARGNEAVPYALVTVKRDEEVLQKAYSSIDGGFAFTDLVPGLYTLAVTAPGYAPRELSGHRVFARRSQDLVTIPMVEIGYGAP